MNISVDLHGLDDGLDGIGGIGGISGFDDGCDRMGAVVAGPRLISPALDESLGNSVSSPIGFSPLGAGRLMYSQFR